MQLKDITTDWIKLQMKKYGLIQNDIVKDFEISKQQLSQNLSNKYKLSKALKVAFKYYFENLKMKEKMKHLITMEQYVIDIVDKDEHLSKVALNMLYDYAKLLQSKPTKEHFIGDNAIFDGWSVDVNTENIVRIVNGLDRIVFQDNIYFNGNYFIQTLSDLTKFNLKLK